MNGDGEHPVFTWLKSRLPLPSDDAESLMGDPKFIIWKPVSVMFGTNDKIFNDLRRIFSCSNAFKEIFNIFRQSMTAEILFLYWNREFSFHSFMSDYFY